MSEHNLSPGAAPPPSEQATSSAQRAGAMLRQAREQAGLHVEALAVALKVPVKKLEALEAGRIDLLPDATFARGLAASICRGLKVDPKPVLELMPGIAGERMAVAPPAINARFEPGAASTGSATLRGSPGPATWVVLVLLLGALAIYLWPSMNGGAGDQEAAAPATPMGAPTTVTESVAPAEPAAPVAAPEPAPVTTAPAGPAVPASAAAPAQAALLQFVAKGETWVQVTDAAGNVPLRRSLVAGETVSATGTPPLSVVIGRIDAVDVQVRGEPRDLRAIAKNNVARFEVK